MTAPERIWMTSPDSEGEVEVWLDPDDGGIEYILHTRAVLAASPLVQEIVAEAVKAEREAIQDTVQVMRREAGRKADGVRFQALDDVRAAIRARGEGQPQEKGE